MRELQVLELSDNAGIKANQKDSSVGQWKTVRDLSNDNITASGELLEPSMFGTTLEIPMQ